MVWLPNLLTHSVSLLLCLLGRVKRADSELAFSNWMESYVFTCSSFSSGLSWMVVFSLEFDFSIYVPKLFLLIITALQGRYQHSHFILEIWVHPRPCIQSVAKQEFPAVSAHSQPPPSHGHRMPLSSRFSCPWTSGSELSDLWGPFRFSDCHLMLSSCWLRWDQE